MIGQLKLVTAPSSEPITLTEAKRRLRVTVNTMDDDITAIIAECRSQLEAETGRAFMPQTWSLFLDDFPPFDDEHRGEIRLPLPPLTSVTWVKYYDTAGDLQTMDAADYYVASAGAPGRIVPVTYWPAVQAGRPESVEVRFVAGYANAAAVPSAVKAALYALIVDRHTNPDGGERPIPPAVERLRLGVLNTGAL